MSRSSSTLDEVILQARARRAPLAGETPGYIVLELAELLTRAPRNASSADVALDDTGRASVLGGERCDDEGAAAAVRALLRELLPVTRMAPPALERIAERDGGGLDMLVRQLSAALVPLNREAARRSIARLAREVSRCAPLAATARAPAPRPVGSSLRTSVALAPASPAPSIASPAPSIASPAPSIASPAPSIASPAPSIASPASSIASPSALEAPVLAAPVVAAVVPAPAVTAPVVTAPVVAAPVVAAPVVASELEVAANVVDEALTPVRSAELVPAQQPIAVPPQLHAARSEPVPAPVEAPLPTNSCDAATPTLGSALVTPSTEHRGQAAPSLPPTSWLSWELSAEAHEQGEQTASVAEQEDDTFLLDAAPEEEWEEWFDDGAVTVAAPAVAPLATAPLGSAPPRFAPRESSLEELTARFELAGPELADVGRELKLLAGVDVTVAPPRVGRRR